MKTSIIIPAHNEEKFLPECLAAIQKSAEIADLQPEIIVVANRCHDQTIQIAKNHGCLVIENEHRNLSKIRNDGLRQARGEVILTIDADSLMSENLLSKVKLAMESGKFIGGGVNILTDRFSPGIIVSLIVLIPFLLYYRVTCGCFFFRRDLAEEIGFFNEEMYSAEDIDFAVRLRKHGKKSGLKFKNLLSAHIVTSSRKFDQFGDWYAFKHPIKTLKLLKGKKSKFADQIWYDFKE